MSRGYDENDLLCKYSLRKIYAICNSSRENANDEEDRLTKAIGIGVRYGMNATGDEFNRWLKETR